MFDVLLALKRRGDCFVRLKIHQRFDVVPLGEALGQPLAMLVNTPHQIVGHTDVQSSAGFACEDVYPIGHFEV